MVLAAHHSLSNQIQVALTRSLSLFLARFCGKYRSWRYRTSREIPSHDAVTSPALRNLSPFTVPSCSSAKGQVCGRLQYPYHFSVPSSLVMSASFSHIFWLFIFIKNLFTFQIFSLFFLLFLTKNLQNKYKNSKPRAAPRRAGEGAAGRGQGVRSLRGPGKRPSLGEDEVMRRRSLGLSMLRQMLDAHNSRQHEFILPQVSVQGQLAPKN